MLFYIKLFFMMVCVVNRLVYSLPVSSGAIDIQKKRDDLNVAFNYLNEYGYLHSNSLGPEEISTNTLINAIKKLQRYGNVPQTGTLDKKTIQMMKLPRCGVPDENIQKKFKSRTKRFLLYGSGIKWDKNVVTYYVDERRTSRTISHDNVRRYISKAFSYWQQHLPFKFQEVGDSSADIYIFFAVGYHDNGYGRHQCVNHFEGRGNTLAHAFAPVDSRIQESGDIHFDDDEIWTIDPKETGKTDFFSTAIHEIGHSVGMRHSDVVTAIMYKTYQVFFADSFQFHQDDLWGIDCLYRNENCDKSGTISNDIPQSHPKYTFEGDDGWPEDHLTHDWFLNHVLNNFYENVRVFGYPGRLSSHRHICNGHFDAVIRFQEELMIIKKDFVWRMKGPGVLADRYYPVSINNFFGLQEGTQQSISNVTAGYQHPGDSTIIIFSGDKTWIFDGNSLQLRGIRNSQLGAVDAAMALQNFTYFFGGNKYWMSDERNTYSGYVEQLLSNRNITTLDAVMTWNDGITYVFKGNEFWGYNFSDIYKPTLLPGYPKTASNYWIGCDL